MKKPNIITIIPHDTGRHFGCYGKPGVSTPAIDSIANDGVCLTNLFATSSICSPSRGSLFTGSYPQSNGLIGLAGSIWQWELNDRSQHLASQLGNVGYNSILFGLQHETANENVPHLGFSEWRCPHPVGTNYDQHKDKPDAIAISECVAEFIQSYTQRDTPFYAQVGFFETHWPYDLLGAQPVDHDPIWIPPYADDDDTTRRHMAQLLGSIRTVDAGVNIILDALRTSGLEQDTLVIFTVDHGFELPGGASPARAKWSMFDPGLEIACLMRWPGGNITGGRTLDTLLSNVDILPTVCDLIDIEIPNYVDGISFSRQIMSPGSEASCLRDTVYALFVNGGRYMARTCEYKIIRYFNEGFADTGKTGLHPVVELYDLQKDPLEQHNVAANPLYQHAYDDMSKRLWLWLEDVDDPILHGPVPTPTYNKAIREYRQFRRR
ncbi:MAG: sulfatase-like hydrolase/transferase [Chitinivibrionales bacterium]|nr:sulfatase-like hydrolase/transferase [Chitinivibrionales bacterium]